MRLGRGALHWLIWSLLLCIGCIGCTGVPEGLEPVEGFETDRYLGTWFEIARFDHSFERGLEDVSATYTRREDRGLRVRNRGYDPEQGEWREAIGRAYPIGDPSVATIPSVCRSALTETMQCAGDPTVKRALSSLAR